MQSEEKVTLEALLQQDLREYIENLGLSESLTKGELVCGFCNTPIKLEEITAIYYENKEPKFACSKPLCYQEALGKNNR